MAVPIKRFITEIEEVKKNYDLELLDENIRHWNVAVTGPINTPYSEGVYIVDLVFPVEYPFKPPDVKINTKIFHPNISNTGKVCLDLLVKWTATNKILEIINMINFILINPDPYDNLNPDAASLYINNKTKFLQTAAEWNTKYAI